jgi:CheY-like chemotaxis protein
MQAHSRAANVNAPISGGNLMTRLTGKVGARNDFQLQVYYDRTSRDEIPVAEDRDTIDADFQNTTRLGRRDTVTWGAAYRVSSGRITAVAPTAFLPGDRTDRLYSAFVQDEVVLSPNRLRATLGSKVEHNDYSGVELQPTARILWTPNAANTTWAAVTRAVRTPSRGERDYGLGLGLAIVKERTELHGGAVSAGSRGVGHGATFTVAFPRLLVAASDAWREDSNAIVAPPVRLDGIDVLAVDDNQDALDIVTAALTSVGARVRTASTGLSAVEQFAQAAPQVILCDLAMPGMDGFEVLRRIRQGDGMNRVTPVLAVTAYASEEYRQRCRETGFQGHLSKPYNTRELIREVASAVART